MAGSALLNSPPATPQDVLIQKGMRQFKTKMNPVKSLPYGPHRPSPDSPDDFSGNTTLGLAITFLILIVTVTIGRFLATTWKRGRKFGLDDFFLLMAAPVAAAYVSLTVYEFSSRKCAGRHMWFCTYEDMNEIYLIFNIDQTIFYFSVYCAKISVLFYLRRLTNAGPTLYTYAHWTILMILVSCGLISLFGTAFQCMPIAGRWSFATLANITPEQYRCIDNIKFQLGVRGMHIGTDFLLLLFPIFVLSRLSLPLSKKIGICLIFSTGTVCIVSSLVRNVIYSKRRKDYPYQNNDVYILNLIDVSCASIVASMPAYYPMLNNIWKRARDALGLSNAPLRTTTNFSKNIYTNPVVSYVSRILHPKRHAPNPSSRLDSISGNYYLSQDSTNTLGRTELITSANVNAKQTISTLSSNHAKNGIMVTDEFEMEEGLAGGKKSTHGEVP